MATTTTIPAFRESRGGWISSPGWDLFWMFSAVWGCALLLLATVFLGMGAVGAAVLAGGLYLGITHSWSTTYMVIASPLMRDARRGNRLKFSYVPLAVVSGSLLLGVLVGVTGAFPSRFPLTAEQSLWGLYLALFWVGHFWHFGNQDFGVLSIYRLKAGQSGIRDRRVDKAYAVAMMFVIQPFIYLKSVSTSPASEAFFSFLPFSRAFVAAGAEVAIVTAVILTVGILAFETSKEDHSVPKLLYYLVMLSHPVLLFFVRFELGFFYLVAYFWSHWLIAIGLVGRINTNYYRNRGSSPARAILRHLRSLGAIVVIAAVFYAAFSKYSVFSGKNYKSILGVVPPEYAAIVGLLLGCFLAEQLLHYYCDRCLFRFRDPSVRKSVAPLV